MHQAVTRLERKWVAWADPLAARWVARRVGKWVARVPLVAKWQVAWAHQVDKWVVPVLRVAKWLAPVLVRWPVAWARPVAKWAAWA